MDNWIPLKHLIQIKQILWIATIAWFLYLIKGKLQGQWFESADDRDGSLIMGAIVGLNIFFWIYFGQKLSNEVLAGIAIGFAQAISIIIGHFYKQKNGGHHK